MEIIAVAALLLAVGFASALWARQRPGKSSEGPAPQMSSYDDRAVLRALDTLSDRLDAHSERITETRAAVAHGIQHAERIERRIKGTVRRAIEELEDGVTPALRAEAEELGLFDGDGGYEGTVPPVPGVLGEDQASSVPGVTREQLQKVRFG